MTKKLDTDAIANELAGSSVFFQKPTEPIHSHPSPTSPKRPARFDHSVPESRSQAVEPPAAGKNNVSMGVSQPVQKEDNPIAPQPVSGLASYQASTIERIRKIVKDGGREVAFTRLSAEEKQQIKDLVYTYGRQGIKTSENEIVRIALNYILEDYQESGKESILEKVINALNA